MKSKQKVKGKEQLLLQHAAGGQRSSANNAQDRVTGFTERMKGLAGLTTDAFSSQDDYKDFKAVSVTVSPVALSSTRSHLLWADCSTHSPTEHRLRASGCGTSTRLPTSSSSAMVTVDRTAHPVQEAPPQPVQTLHQSHIILRRVAASLCSARAGQRLQQEALHGVVVILSVPPPGLRRQAEGPWTTKRTRAATVFDPFPCREPQQLLKPAHAEGTVAAALQSTDEALQARAGLTVGPAEQSLKRGFHHRAHRPPVLRQEGQERREGLALGQAGQTLQQPQEPVPVRAAPQGQEPVLHSDAGSGGDRAVPLVQSAAVKLEDVIQQLLPQLLLVRRRLLQLRAHLLESRLVHVGGRKHGEELRLRLLQAVHQTFQPPLQLHALLICFILHLLSILSERLLQLIPF
ncbi:hypothetical protein EYF80_002155 [Liparis tanakae]|uniref:Uncharacterized protein n=1 Tax=Liparis tanakae TaxID=230148 RepID=A0A4Z2JCU0_9TELE|nr:hypothetical protein EYF80_002155 [Liparis tanakae]